MSPLARLASFLDEEERRAAETLAASRSKPVEEIPQLVRVLEEIAAVRRFQELRDRGETIHCSLTRTARDLGIRFGTLRSRLRPYRAKDPR